MFLGESEVATFVDGGAVALPQDFVYSVRPVDALGNEGDW